MSMNRKRVKRGKYSRRDQRRTTLLVTLLFTLSVAAIAMMAVVNRLPIGRRYTYTQAGDLWFVDEGDMQIAAPEVVLFTEEPEATPTPEPSPTPTSEPEAEEEYESLAEIEDLWGSGIDSEAAPASASGFPLPGDAE